MIDTPKPAPAEACLHLVLAAMSPFQSILDKPGFTHEFCNQQALSILRKDGFSEYSDLLVPCLAELNLGVYWADKGWKNVHHYFEPCSGKGLWNFTHAIDNFEIYYRSAQKAVKQYNVKKAAFFLGAAAHLLQDLCVPHHARAKLFNGHKQYEGWVQERCGKYAASAQGIYQEELSPLSLIMNNAFIAADFFDWVRHEGDDTLYNKATEVLLPLAQRSTAGLFRTFASEVLSLGQFKQGITVA